MTALLQASGASSAATLAAGSTVFNPCANGFFSVGSGAPELDSQLTYRTAGTLSKLWANVPTNTVNASSTLRVRVNGGNGNEVISIGASTTGLFEDAVNTDAIAAGDEVALSLVTGGASGAISVQAVATLFAATTNSGQRLTCSGNASVSTASVSRFFPFAGNWDSAQATEANAEQRTGVAGTIRNLFLDVESNGRATTTTFGSRKNGGPGNLTISVGSGASGLFEDTVNTDSFAVGDLGCVVSTTGTGTDSLVLTQISTEFVNATDDGLIMVGKAGSGWSLGFGATRFGVVGGATSTLQITENDVRTNARTPFTAKELSAFVSGNTINGASTLTLDVDNSPSALTVSVGASTTGRFTDSTHTVAVVAANTITYRFVGGGSSGTSAWRTISMAGDFTQAVTSVLRDVINGPGVVPFPV